MGFIRGQEIGRGTYGVVYEGVYEYDDGKKQKGASKNIFRKNNIAGIGIFRELQILKTCSSRCKYVPKLLGVCFQDYTRKSLDKNLLKNESAVFIMEHLDYSGVEVFGKMNYDITCILDMISQMISGIAYMHSKIVTHRDLKPANILISFDSITRKPIVKITDFGISQYLVNSVNSTPNTNTPWYRAPELCWQNPKYGASSDVWALGATIFEILTGTVFSAPHKITDSELFYSILEKNPNQWTKEIHQLYIEKGSTAIKIGKNFNPVTLKSGEALFPKFQKSRYYNKNDKTKWLKLEKILISCFNYDYTHRISCWHLLDNDLFDDHRDEITITKNEICRSRVNEVVVIKIPEDINKQKVEFFQNFMLATRNFSRRQLFHAAGLFNKLIMKDEFKEECKNIPKICTFCVYFFHKFFCALMAPYEIHDFFGSIVNTTNIEEYYALDEWIYNLELKIISILFVDFKIYKISLFEVPDEYRHTLTPAQVDKIFMEFLEITDWSEKSYRNMYRELYLKHIDKDYIFK